MEVLLSFETSNLFVSFSGEESPPLTLVAWSPLVTTETLEFTSINRFALRGSTTRRGWLRAVLELNRTEPNRTKPNRT